jgi:hypothetical protein
VGFLYPDKQIDGSFVKCCPKNNDRQIVFTQPGPEAAMSIRTGKWSAPERKAAVKKTQNSMLF